MAEVKMTAAGQPLDNPIGRALAGMMNPARRAAGVRVYPPDPPQREPHECPLDDAEGYQRHTLACCEECGTWWQVDEPAEGHTLSWWRVHWWDRAARRRIRAIEAEEAAQDQEHEYP